jgi:hypothetical protein
MTDTTVTPKPPLFSVSNHPKVSASVLAGAVASLVLALAKAHWGVDLVGQEANITVVVMGVIGYLVPNSNGG